MEMKKETHKDGQQNTISIKDVGLIIADYDRTLTDEFLRPVLDAFLAIKNVKSSFDIQFFIVSGRNLKFLMELPVCNNICDAIVAENGAIIYSPKTKQKIYLGQPFDVKKLATLLKNQDINVDVFESILSTSISNYDTAKELIKKHQLDVDLEINRDTVMALPSKVNKASGVKRAIRISESKGLTVSIGDGENDFSLFSVSDFKVAVSNAHPALIDKADYVCRNPGGYGVAEFIKLLSKNKGA